MHSFHQLSLVLSILLLSCSPGQTEHSNRHENARARHRRTERLNDSFDVKYKRGGDVSFTYFADGQGACGAVNGPNDYIVALNSADYAGGSHCFEMITITIDGKSQVAQVADECPTCPPGGVDLSQGLFQYFAPLYKGQIYGSWSYNKDMTTSSSAPAPTTTYASSLTSATPPAPTSATSSVSTVSSPTSTPFAIPTSTTQNPQILTEVNLSLLELGIMLQTSLKLEN